MSEKTFTSFVYKDYVIENLRLITIGKALKPRLTNG